mmetsp:Transcript_12573/g.16348  ORF Transcript_12573/g.16348 Transcript_12573/m.16348 type:complete len:231 (-) Transcript_12573:328-1020(-)
MSKPFLCVVLVIASSLLLTEAAPKTDNVVGFASPFTGPKAKNSKLQRKHIHQTKVFKHPLMMAAESADEATSPANETSPEASAVTESETTTENASSGEEEIPEEELTEDQKKMMAKQKEIERLRAAEKFITKMTGEFQCSQCNYIYKPDEGAPGVIPGTGFADLPSGWRCPECSAPRSFFDALTITIAGFEENQGYGFGTNSMTGDQKNSLIFGGLGIFFLLFLSGYLLD